MNRNRCNDTPDFDISEPKLLNEFWECVQHKGSNRNRFNEIIEKFSTEMETYLKIHSFFHHPYVFMHTCVYILREQI